MHELRERARPIPFRALFLQRRFQSWFNRTKSAPEKRTQKGTEIIGPFFNAIESPPWSSCCSTICRGCCSWAWSLVGDGCTTEQGCVKVHFFVTKFPFVTELCYGGTWTFSTVRLNWVKFGMKIAQPCCRTTAAVDWFMVNSWPFYSHRCGDPLLRIA